MTPKEIRIELLRQHAELRHMIEAARRIAGRLRAGESLRQELKASANRLDNELDEHNRCEEQWLREVFPAAGTSTDHHAEIMTKRHFEEHRTLHKALLDVNLEPDDAWAARNFMDALDCVVDHMTREESTFADLDAWTDEDTQPG